jgi:hypothetical protein
VRMAQSSKSTRMWVVDSGEVVAVGVGVIVLVVAGETEVAVVVGAVAVVGWVWDCN